MWLTSAPADSTVEYWSQESLPPYHLDQRNTVHEAHLTRLNPATLYHYRVSSGSAKGPILTFRTAPLNPTKFKFVVYGQTAGDPERHARLVEAIVAHDPTFVVHTGNFTTHKNDAAAWQREFFEPAKALLGNRALVPVPGANEQRSRWYPRFFPTPTAAPWHTYRYGTVAVFVLDLSDDFTVGDEQCEWLGGAFGRNPAPWKLVAFHPPLFGAGPSGGSARLRRALFPSLVRYGADVTFCGGDPIYERTHPIGAGAKPERNAIVNFVTGGGAGRRCQVAAGPWTAKALAAHHFLLVEVDGDQLTVSAIGVDGRVLDSVVLRKSGRMRQREGALSAEALEAFLAFQPPDGFDLGECTTEPVKKTFSVVLENPYETPIEGELRWESTNAAWQIEPSVLKILVPPLGLKDVAFSATVRPPNVEPLPACSFVAGKQELKAHRSPFRVRVQGRDPTPAQ